MRPRLHCSTVDLLPSTTPLSFDRSFYCHASHLLSIQAVDKPGSSGRLFSLGNMSYTRPKHRFRLKPGQWTQPAATALCLADSLIERRAFDGSDVRVRFWNWWCRGLNNGFGNDKQRACSVGAGAGTARGILEMQPGIAPPATCTQGEDSGNGSLVRLAPLSIFFATDAERCRLHARDSSRTTHPGAIAEEACVLLAHIVRCAICYRQPAGSYSAAAFLDEVSAEYLILLAKRVAAQGREQYNRGEREVGASA